jgi:hypothetical protein
MQENTSPKISRHNMSTWRHNFRISEEISNPQHFNWHKSVKINRVLTEEKFDATSHLLENSTENLCSG